MNTTCNREYNVKWERLPAGQFRHKDHWFEWTRAEFQELAGRKGSMTAISQILPSVKPANRRWLKWTPDGRKELHREFERALTETKLFRTNRFLVKARRMMAQSGKLD